MTANQIHQDKNLLSINKLKVYFDTKEGKVRAVDDVNLNLAWGERVCLVGESGSGKSILALALLRLLPASACYSGSLIFKGQDLLKLSHREMRKIRSKGIGMIFEQPFAYLNPVFSAGWQIAETVRISRGCSRKESKQRALQLLDMVCIPEARKRYHQFPHQLSGGMRQRVMIALALAKDPHLLVADEPTTALDPTVRMGIFALLRDCLQETGAALLCITHDWNTARSLCERATVMYAGHILETGSAEQVLEVPRHPYTNALLQAMDNGSPKPIPGEPPALTDLPHGCRFKPRCVHCLDKCAGLQKIPALNRGVRCHNPLH